ADVLKRGGLNIVIAWLILTLGSALVEFLSGRSWKRIGTVTLTVAVLSGVGLVALSHSEGERPPVIKEAKASAPVFAGEFDRIVLGIVNETSTKVRFRGKSFLTIIATLRNSGAASVAYNYGLTVKLSDGEQLTGERVAPPDGATIRTPASNELLVLHRS